MHVGCCALFILMWLRCGIRCDVEYVRYGVMTCVTLYNVKRGVVKCGDAMWNDGVVHGEYGGVLMQDVKLMWLWNTVMWNGLMPY